MAQLNNCYGGNVISNDKSMNVIMTSADKIEIATEWDEVDS